MRTFLYLVLLCSVCFAFRKDDGSSGKRVSICGLHFVMPEGWKMQPATDDYGRILTGMDTIVYGMYIVNYPVLPEKMIPYECHDEDTACERMNREVENYNDSLIKAHPEMVTHNDTFIYHGRKLRIAAIYPNEGIKAFSTYVVSSWNKSVSMYTSAISRERAMQIIAFLSTAQRH